MLDLGQCPLTLIHTFPQNEIAFLIPGLNLGPNFIHSSQFLLPLILRCSWLPHRRVLLAPTPACLRAVTSSPIPNLSNISYYHPPSMNLPPPLRSIYSTPAQSLWERSFAIKCQNFDCSIPTKMCSARVYWNQRIC